MSDEAKLVLPIEGRDDTEKAVKSVSKRYSELAKELEKGGKRLSDVKRRQDKQAANDDEANTRRRKQSLFSYAKAAHQAFSQMEQSAARTLGTRSVSGGLGGILTQGGNALGIFRTAMGGVAEGAGAMEVALGGAVGAVGAGIGVLVAGTIAAQKFGATWADNAAKVGRFAQIWGVNAQTLQAFEAGAQRSGAEKGAGMQAISGMEASLNAALYGKDGGTGYETLRQLKLAIPTKKDGSLDLNEKFLGQFSDALSKLNPEGRRQVASQFGIPLDVLPFLTRGGKALQTDLNQSSQYSNVQSDAALADAERSKAKTESLTQLKDRGMGIAGHKAAMLTEGVLDKEITAAKGISDAVNGNTDILKKTNDKISDFLDTFMSWGPTARTPSRMQGSTSSRANSGSFSDRVEINGERSRQDQVSPKGAVGVMQILPSTAQQVARDNNIPWDEKRFRTDADYNRMLGKKYADQLFLRYHGNEHLAAAAYNAGPGNVDKWIHKFGDPSKGQISPEEFSRRIPFKETRDYVGRVANPSKVHVTVEMKGAPPGTKVTARSTGGAVSTAMTN